MTSNAPHPSMTQPDSRPGKNSLATAGFVLGLIGLIFSFIPFVGIVAWPLVILGIIFAVIGFVRARKGAPNKGLSIAGIVCSVLGLVICILAASVFTSAVNDAADDLEAAGGGTNAVSEDIGKPSAGMGEAVSDGMFEFTVNKVETGTQHVGDQYTGADAQGQFVIVHVSVHNTGDEPRSLNMSAQNLYDAQGKQYEASAGDAAMALPDSEAFLNNINPGNSVDAKLLFDVPEDMKLGNVELHDSLMSGGATVSLKKAE